MQDHRWVKTVSVIYTGDDPYRIDFRYSGVLFHLRGSY